MIDFNIDEALDIPQLEESEQSLLERISLIDALQKLSEEEREMLLLRYVNDVPASVISRLYHISRFAVYRRLKRILKKVKDEMEGENE
jgi:RNA polymerase sigma-70 factor (ECF subfamily)